MAVAEARAVWQRTANRCFVQEDAKRAPKLACCPSTSSSTKPVDAAPTSPDDGKENLTPGFTPLNRNPSYTNLPPESRWWLQLPPNYGFQRGMTIEQVGSLEAEMESFQASTLSGSHPQAKGGGPCIAKDAHGTFKAEGRKESYKLVEMDSAASKELTELSSGPGFSWIGSEKSEPWWRKTDGDELASFVARRSLDLIDNCDLPQPQNINAKRVSYGHAEHLDQDGTFTSYKDWTPQIVGCPNRTVHARGTISGSAHGKNWSSVELQTQSGTGKPISEGTIHKGTSFIEMPISEADPSKAQLLEALRHSQTRAREAEKAAKEAYTEKEHIVKLLFRQASHLFTYKQWFHLLQLENLYFQIKNNKNFQPVLPLFPVNLPWVAPRKARKGLKNRQKPPKNGAKRGLPGSDYDISKYAVVFALGLSLVGAGLLLGWTLGWMLHAL